MVYMFKDGTVVKLKDICCFLQQETRIQILLKSGVTCSVNFPTICDTILEFGQLITELKPDIEINGNRFITIENMILDSSEISALGKNEDEEFLIIFRNGSKVLTNYPEEFSKEQRDTEFEKIVTWMKK